MSFLAGTRDFSLLQNVQTGSTDCAVSCSLGVRFLVLRVRNGWSYTSASLYAFMAWTVIVFISARSLWPIHSKISVTTVLRPETKDTPSIFSAFQ